jgi:hypothetical protein
MKNKIGNPDLPKTGEQDGFTDKQADMQWIFIVEALTIAGIIYVPEALRNQVISLFHDHPETSHFGALRTAELLSGDSYWRRLDTSVRKYVVAWDVCHQLNALCHTQYGAGMPLPLPLQNRWHRITMHFTTTLPGLWSKSTN